MTEKPLISFDKVLRLHDNEVANNYRKNDFSVFGENMLMDDPHCSERH